MILPNGKKVVCCNQNTGPDEETFSCSLHGQLVTIGCCMECLTRATETPEQKRERAIRLNERLIIYHQEEIGRLRLETAKLSSQGRNNHDATREVYS